MCAVLYVSNVTTVRPGADSTNGYSGLHWTLYCRSSINGLYGTFLPHVVIQGYEA
jgi:hypothetical protein